MKQPPSRDGADSNKKDASRLTGQVGRAFHRLRKAYNLSLSELSEQSGVAKSIISQIERNETNPTLATIWRLSQALDVSIDRVLTETEESPFLDFVSEKDQPLLRSDDARVQLTIMGWSKTVEWLQWYWLKAEQGGQLASSAHERGSVESLSVISGLFRVEVKGEVREVKAGESLRYRCDAPHSIEAITPGQSEAVMVCILKASVME